MRQAKVYVSVMGDEQKQQLCLHGLQSAAGYLQKKVSTRIDTRYTPRLEFVLDLGIKKSIEIAQILKEVIPSDTDSDTPDADESQQDDGLPSAAISESPPPDSFHDGAT